MPAVTSACSPLAWALACQTEEAPNTPQPSGRCLQLGRPADRVPGLCHPSQAPAVCASRHQRALAGGIGSSLPNGGSPMLKTLFATVAIVALIAAALRALFARSVRP